MRGYFSDVAATPSEGDTAGPSVERVTGGGAQASHQPFAYAFRSAGGGSACADAPFAPCSALAAAWASALPASAPAPMPIVGLPNAPPLPPPCATSVAIATALLDIANTFARMTSVKLAGNFEVIFLHGANVRVGKDP
jgi:hypothetical protein